MKPRTRRREGRTYSIWQRWELWAGPGITAVYTFSGDEARRRAWEELRGELLEEYGDDCWAYQVYDLGHDPAELEIDEWADDPRAKA